MQGLLLTVLSAAQRCTDKVQKDTPLASVAGKRMLPYFLCSLIGIHATHWLQSVPVSEHCNVC
jgi:hypothetical protein